MRLLWIQRYIQSERISKKGQRLVDCAVRRRHARTGPSGRRIVFSVREPPAFLIFLAIVLQSGCVPAAAFEEDVERAYGVTPQGIARAIDDARRDFAAHPDDTVILDFAPGHSDLSHAPIAGRGVIDVSDIHPGDHGRLILHGAGSKRTTFVFNRDAAWIYGRDTSRVSFVGLRMTASQYTVSQGHVLSVAAGAVVLVFEDGYPSPGELFNPDRSGRSAGRYLRRYTDSADDPHLIESGNAQIPWSGAERISRNICRIILDNRQFKPDYHPGDFVCVKSKRNGNAYCFLGGNDITFDDVVWTLKSRGVFRGGVG